MMHRWWKWRRSQVLRDTNNLMQGAGPKFFVPRWFRPVQRNPPLPVLRGERPPILEFPEDRILEQRNEERAKLQHEWVRLRHHYKVATAKLNQELSDREREFRREKAREIRSELRQVESTLVNEFSVPVHDETLRAFDKDYYYTILQKHRVKPDGDTVDATFSDPILTALRGAPSVDVELAQLQAQLMHDDPQLSQSEAYLQARTKLKLRAEDRLREKDASRREARIRALRNRGEQAAALTGEFRAFVEQQGLTPARINGLRKAVEQRRAHELTTRLRRDAELRSTVQRATEAGSERQAQEQQVTNH